MSGNMESPNVREYFQFEERQNQVAGNKLQERWVVPVAVVAGAIFAAVCFGVGFAIAYFAVPSAGRSLSRGPVVHVYATQRIVFL